MTAADSGRAPAATAAAVTAPRGDEIRPRSTDLSRRDAVRVTVVLWTIAAVFGAITLARSHHLGIALRDPNGQMFRHRLLSAVVLCIVFALAESLVRVGWRRVRAGGTGSWARVPREVVAALRERWTLRRTALVASGLLAYHVVYVCYRNLKSWDAFNANRDAQLLDLDRALFLGHSPAVLLHDLLGQDQAAVVLTAVYRSFTYLVVLAVVGTLAALPRVRDAYVMLCAGVWVWILGVASYYAVPSLGPFASAPQDFASLPHTANTLSQGKYLVERAYLLTHPGAPDAFASISAFASLHVGFTCTILLVAVYYRWRTVSVVLAVYEVAVMAATVYFGWHFVLDDLAGVVLAVLAVSLAVLMVPGARWRGARAPVLDRSG